MVRGESSTKLLTSTTTVQRTLANHSDTTRKTCCACRCISVHQAWWAEQSQLIAQPPSVLFVNQPHFNRNEAEFDVILVYYCRTASLRRSRSLQT
jgi:hypothetical protein